MPCTPCTHRALVLWQAMYILYLEGHRVYLREIGFKWTCTKVIDLTAVISHIEFTACRDKRRDNVGERQSCYNRIRLGINHMQALALLHGIDILPKSHHIAALVVIEAVVVAPSAGLRALYGASNCHAGDIQHKDAGVGRDITFLVIDSAIGATVIYAVG